MNYGNVNIKGGNINIGDYGIQNYGNCTMNSGTIYNLKVGIQNYGTFTLNDGSIKNNSNYGVYNAKSNAICGQFYMTGGEIIQNTVYDIYHEKSDNDTVGATYGGLRIENDKNIQSKIYLANDDSYIYVGSNNPIFTSITVANISRGRKIIRASNVNNALNMQEKINVINRGKYYYKANIIDKPEYVVLWSKSKVAEINFEDSLSGIKNAVYWYNPNKEEFIGEGIELTNGQVFENYGYYKVMVTNGVDSKKSQVFILNEDVL